LQHAYDTKEFDGLSVNDKLQWGFYFLHYTGAYRNWPEKTQTELFQAIRKHQIPIKRSSLVPQGIDRFGKKIEDYTILQYEQHRKEQEYLQQLKRYSSEFSRRWRKQKFKVENGPRPEEYFSFKDRRILVEKDVPYDLKEIEAEWRRPLYTADLKEEQQRRKEIYNIQTGKKMATYGSNPIWDDIKPIPQDDGENPLAAIAYSDEYAEGMSGHVLILK